MEKIVGYDIKQWALFFRVASIAKYVVDVAEKTKQQTFIQPLAEEIDRVMELYFQGKLNLPDVNLSYRTRKEIVEYMERHISPVTNTRTVNPPILLLTMLDRLFEDDFKPLYKLVGTTSVRDFISTFVDKCIESKEIQQIYFNSTRLIQIMMEPDYLTVGERITINRYRKAFDGLYCNVDNLAHGLDHINSVLYKAIRLKNKYNIDVATDEVVVAALFHDMFEGTDRNNHHQLGHDWIKSSIHPLIKLNKEKNNRIAKAILEHRASYDGAFTSALSELISTADRDTPNINDIILRSYKHQLVNNPGASHIEQIELVRQHIIDKYSRTGYITYTKLYLIEHGTELEVLFNIIDKIANNKLKIKIATRKGNYVVSLKEKR